MKRIWFLPLLFITALSCKKTDEAKADMEKLTGCPVGSECHQLFTEQADADAVSGAPKIGSYRLFWSEVQQGPLTSKLVVKAPMAGNSFSLNKADIISGKILFIQNCPACNLIPFKPVDGYVKGTNARPGIRADQTKWLLEANILLEATGQPMVKDTIFIKQYFYPNFIYD